MLEPLTLHPLGATNVQVPSLCLGCAALGDMPGTFSYSVAEEQALATIRAIFEGPISFADTAASYGDGESERRIGCAPAERQGDALEWRDERCAGGAEHPQAEPGMGVLLAAARWAAGSACRRGITHRSQRLSAVKYPRCRYAPLPTSHRLYN